LNTKHLSEIEGSKAKSNIFQGFNIKEILIEYDFPLLLEASSPQGDSWLFKWCDTIEHKLERWIALPISESRLNAIKNDKISLREAVTLPEKEFYIFDTKSLFEPSEIKKSSPEKLPLDYLPSDDISVHGNLLGIEPPENEHLKVRLHVFSEHISEGRAPLPLISNLQLLFQQYMIWVSHAFDKSTEVAFISPVLDWSRLDLVAVTSGSFKMECESKSTNEQTEKLAKACELLAALSNGTFDKEVIKKEFAGIYRSDIVLLASSLAHFISNSKLSMSISWATSNNPKGYFAIDRRRARKYFKSLYSLRDTQYDRNITIQLTPKEADPLRKEVKGDGGMEDLLRRLQKKLKDDNTISLSSDDIEKVLRYSSAYGQGGFENKLIGLAMTLRRIGIPFNTA
jgi:hypothetical protein